MAHPTTPLGTILTPDQIVSQEQLPSSTQARLLSALADPKPSPQIDQASPQTPQQLAEVVSVCRHQGWPLLVMGSGSKLHWGDPLQIPAGSPLVVIRTARLDRILDHASADLTVTVEAGITLGSLQQHLARSHQFWPVNPLYGEQASLGGIIAANTSGSWRHRYGGIRDLVLGITMVRADGQIVKAGGQVVKNVAGYDLMKLLTGSYGTLGILTQVTLRLYPQPQQSQILLIRGILTELEGIRHALFASTLTPVALDLLSAPLADPLQPGQGAGLLIRFHGLPEGVTPQINQLHTLASAASLQISILSPSETEIDRQILTPLEAPTGPLLKLGTLPTQITALLTQIQQIDPDGLVQITGSGVGYWRGSRELDPTAISSLQSLLTSTQGYLSWLELKPRSFDFASTSPSFLQTRIKQTFDPDHRLSPGRIR